MRKFQFFLIVESLLLAMALMTILANDFASFILILVVTLLVLRFYNMGNRSNFLLTTSLLLLFLIFMLNPYIISAVLFGITYVWINHFAQTKKKNRYALIAYRDDLTVRASRNQWIGAHHPSSSDTYALDDVNIIRLSGTDVIDLSQVLATGRDHVILIRKVYGPTQLLVPIDVAVHLDVSAVYGSVRFFDYPEYDLRNEAIKLYSRDSEDKLKMVKLVVNVIAGDVEVVAV